VTADGYMSCVIGTGLVIAALIWWSAVCWRKDK